MQRVIIFVFIGLVVSVVPSESKPNFIQDIDFKSGLSQMRARDYERAINRFAQYIRSIIKLNAMDHEDEEALGLAYHYISICYSNLGKPDLALSSEIGAVKHIPLTRYAIRAARLSAEVGNKSGAERHYRLVVEGRTADKRTSVQVQQARLSLAKLYERAGKLKDAVLLYQECISHDSSLSSDRGIQEAIRTYKTSLSVSHGVTTDAPTTVSTNLIEPSSAPMQRTLIERGVRPRPEVSSKARLGSSKIDAAVAPGSAFPTSSTLGENDAPLERRDLSDFSGSEMPHQKPLVVDSAAVAANEVATKDVQNQAASVRIAVLPSRCWYSNRMDLFNQPPSDQWMVAPDLESNPDYFKAEVRQALKKSFEDSGREVVANSDIIKAMNANRIEPLKNSNKEIFYSVQQLSAIAEHCKASLVAWAEIDGGGRCRCRPFFLTPCNFHKYVTIRVYMWKPSMPKWTRVEYTDATPEQFLQSIADPSMACVDDIFKRSIERSMVTIMDQLDSLF